MRALVLTDTGLVLDAAHPEPAARAGEAVVRVTRAGICGTDLELLRGYKGFRGVPGHEFVGVVERCDSRPRLVGKRVGGEINVGCGECGRCAEDCARHCASREVLGLVGRDGAFAERLALPAANLLEVPANVPDDEAEVAEPAAACWGILGAVPIGVTQRVVVLGRGRLGSLAAAVMQGAFGSIALVGRADPTPSGADVVVEATGSPDGFARALDIVRPRGMIVLKSTCAGGATIPASLLTRIVVNEVTVVGSRCGSHSDFEHALACIESRHADVRPFVAATYRLEDFERAFEHAARPGALKILLAPSA